MKRPFNVRSRSNWLICSVLLLASLVAISTTIAAQKEAKRHTGKNRRVLQFSMKLPKSWAETPNKALEWNKPGAAITVTYVMDKILPEKLREQILEIGPKKTPSWKKTEDEIDEVDGKPYLKVAATFDIDGAKGKIPFVQIQYFIHVNGEKYYTVTCNGPADKFEEIKDEFEEAIETIQID